MLFSSPALRIGLSEVSKMGLCWDRGTGPDGIGGQEPYRKGCGHIVLLVVRAATSTMWFCTAWS